MKKLLLRGNNKICTFLSLLFFTVYNTSLAQVKFSAVCPNKQIGKNEYLQVQYVVENASNVEQITPPAFKNFSIVSGPNQQSSTSIINGAVSQSVALEFILRPTAPGSFTLPPATAKVNGKTLVSNSLSVQVTNNSSPGASSGGASFSPFSNMMSDVFSVPSIHQYDDYILRKGENVSDKIKKNLFIKLDVNKTSCYVGEPIIATYKLYTRLKSESNLTKTPSFNGFSVSEMKMPDNYSNTTEKYNGREYSVYILRKVQLYPLQPGPVVLDPVEVDNHVTFIKAEYADTKNGDIFFDMMRDFVDASTPASGIEERKITLQSKPLSITVKPLPENQPQDFRGAVGAFNIHATVEKGQITTDEAGNLIISVSGNGNIQMINAPLVSWPAGVEAFDPKITENIDNTAVPLKGQKTFTYPFTVSAPGQYEIPAISFSYFDIPTHTYKTLLTPPVIIKVKKGKGIQPLASGKPNVTSEKAETGKNKYLNWLLPVTGFLFGGLLVWFAGRSRGKKAASAIPIPAKEDEQKEIDETAKSEVPVTRHPLQPVEEILLENNISNFYHTLNNCLRKYLAVKLGFAENELTKKKINELLDKHNVGVGTTILLSSLLADIELHLYAPVSSAEHLQKVYENAGEIIALLDKQIS